VKKILFSMLVLLSFSMTANAGIYDSLTAAISFTELAAIVLSIGVLVIGVDLAQLGYMKVRKLIKGAQ